MQFRILLVLLLLVQFSFNAVGQTASKKSPVKNAQAVKSVQQESATKPQDKANDEAGYRSASRSGGSFMFGGTSDISTNNGKDRWLGVLLETALEFKLHNIKNVDFVASDEVFANISGFGTIAAPPTEREYYDVARKLKVTYIGKAKYEVANSRDVQYYLEIISVKDGETYATIERGFNISKLGTEADVIVNELLKALKVPQSPDLVRFLKFPVISEDVRNMKTLGEYLYNSRYSTTPASTLTTDDVRTICAKDKGMILAFWYGGMILEKASLNIEAIEAYKVVNQTFPEYLDVYIPLSRVNRNAGRIESAQGYISMAEKRGVKNTELLVEKALMYQGLKKNAEADAVFKQILAVEPNNAIALLNYARKCNDDGRGKEAEELCNRYLKTNKPNSQIFIEFGRSFVIQSNKNAAINAFVRASQLDSKNMVSVIALADLYASTKSWTDASKYYDKALAVSPDNVELSINAAKAYQAGGSNRKALDLLRKIEPRAQQNAVLNHDLGMLEYAIKENAQAVVHLEKALNAGASDEQMLLALGLLYVDGKQYVKALPLLNKALPLLSDKNQCKIGLAKIQLGLADTDAAVKILDDLATQKVSVPGAYRTIADKYYAQGDKKRSYEYYKKEFALSKDDTAGKKVAELSYELGLWQECKAAYLALAAKDGKSAPNLYRLAIISLQLKDRDGASEFVKKAALLGSADAETYYRLGLGFNALDASRDAAIAFQKCVSSDPTNESALLELSVLLEKMEKDSAAADVNMKLFQINNSKYKERLVFAARLFEKGKLYTQARDACQLFLKKNYVSSEITLQLVRLEYRSKNYSAITGLVDAIPVSKLDTMNLRICAEAFSNQQQYKKVIPYTTAMLQRVPSSVWATELSAVAYDKNSSFDLAATMYKKYQALTKDGQKYGLRLGEIYEQLNRNKAAIEHYEVLSKSMPKDGQIPDHLARLYFKSKDWNNAIAQSRKALSFTNAKADLNLLIGRSSVAVKNQNGAVEGYIKYLKAFESDTAVLTEFAIYSFNNQDYKNAIIAFSNALRFKADNFTVRKYLGISYVKTNEQQKAIPHLEKALEYMKTDKEIISILAMCYTASGDNASVITALKNMCAIDKKNYDARIQLGDLLVANSNYAEAARVLEEAALLKHCAAGINLKLAAIYEKLNKQDLVGGQLRSALACDAKNPDIYYQVYLYFDSRKDTARAMEYLKQTIAISPSHSDANGKIGQILLKRNNPADAVSYLTRSVKAKPTLENKAFLVEALYKVNRSDEALNLARTILAPDTRDPQILKWAGFVMKAAGRTDTATFLLEKAVQVDRNCGQCYYFLGDMYFENGAYSDAVKNYQAANAMAGFSESAQFKIGRVYSIAGKESQARQAYEEIVAKKPQNMEAWYRIFHSYIVQGQYDACRALFPRVANDRTGWISLAKGELLEAEGQLDAALKAWETAFSTLPNDNTEMQAALGRYCLKTKDFSAAIEYFGKAMAGDPENCQYMLDMGKAYEGTKNVTTALDLYNEVKRRRPDFPEVATLIARLQGR